MRSLVMRLVVPLALPFALLSFTCACATLGDKDGDGIKRRDDKCPEAAEDKDGIDDYDGCPEDDDGNITAESTGSRGVELGIRSRLLPCSESGHCRVGNGTARPLR